MSDGDFEQRMLLARLRGLLTTEAKYLVRKMKKEGMSLAVENISSGLMLAVARAQPRSRLVPWHLPDSVVEKMIRVVASSLARTKVAA